MSRDDRRQKARLAKGGLIDRSRPVTFRFDGKSYEGYAGDTLSAALLANDVHLVGRSFKYHRPRGILTDGSHEPNALVTLHSGAYSDPNTKATTVELLGGLEAQSQNRWPSLKHDLMAVNGLFSSLFVAGFYYKTFMWPAAFWEKLYEPLIRRAAGLGALSGEPDPDRYEKAHGFCDVLVVGAGPAGLMAARAAAESGAVIKSTGNMARHGPPRLRASLQSCPMYTSCPAPPSSDFTMEIALPRWNGWAKQHLTGIGRSWQNAP